MKRLPYYLMLLIISPVRWMIYLFSGLFPRSENVWVFGAWDGYRFADNTKWFFIHCLRADYPEKFVWISRERKVVSDLREDGYLAYYYLSVKGIFYCLRAKFYILDHSTQDVNFFTSKNAYKIFLFHGIPLKKLRRDIDVRTNFNYKAYRGSRLQKLILYITRPYLYEKMDYLSCTSPVNAQIYSSAFNIPDEKISVTGYPRNDVFQQSVSLNIRDQASLSVLSDCKQKGKTIIFYLPTWRDHNRNRRDPFDWSLLDRFLEERDCVLITKSHSYDKTSNHTGTDNSNIISLHHSADIYPLLRLTDVLLTDYSSIAFDFLITNRPIVYYCYDIDDYLSNARSFYHDYESVTPGAKAKTFDQLLLSLDEAIMDETYVSRWEEVYKHTMELCHTYTDAKSSERLYADIKKTFIEKRHSDQ